MLIFTQILRKLIRYVSVESYLFNGQCMAGLLPRETAQHLLRSWPAGHLSLCRHAKLLIIPSSTMERHK